MKTYAELAEEVLEHKRSGGVVLGVGVSDATWLGGNLDLLRHAAFVFVGPADWEDERELTFLADHDAVDALALRLRAAAEAAWGPRLEVVHQGRGGHVAIEDARYPIEHVDSGRFVIHAPSPRSRHAHPRHEEHRRALLALVAREPDKWVLEER